MANRDLAGAGSASMQQLWDRMTGTQTGVPHALVLTTGFVALAAVLWRPAWRPLRTVVTIAHEGGHALVALLCGRRLAGIRLHSDTSGVTVSVGRPTGPGMVATAAAGYVTPSLLGAAGAGLLASGHVTMTLWVTIALLALLFLGIRNWYGAFAVVATGSVVGAVSWLAHERTQAVFAYLLVWFLLLAGLRPVVELQQMRHRAHTPQSDADQLAVLTRLPGGLWVTVFGLVSVIALGWGAQALLA